jgi:hypothetical protein
MCGSGCGNQRFNFQPCTILLVIAILANQGLLSDSPTSRNALTLLLLYWLCGCSGGRKEERSECCEERRPCCRRRRRRIKVCCC